jgi:DNA-binding response OmpR family regulator
LARILIIDDDDAIRRPMKVLLERAGHEVVQAADGQEGLRLWREREADLVITDIHMPEKDGIETILELHALRRTVPIIAISGGDQTRRLDLLASAVMLGAVSTLPKPFTLAELLAAVERALGRPPRSGTDG